MRVAIIHYHLRPGGVTRVIQNALSALTETSIQPVVFSGEPSSESMPVPNTAIVEGLEYHNPKGHHHHPEDVVKELISVVKQRLGGLPDLWHIHNHALGKNLVLSEVAYLLARRGHRLLLQIHDFAEDGRADNYKFLRDHLCPGAPEKLGSRLYPQGSHVHYALLNQRDLNFLKASGVETGRLHHLPNAVNTEETAEVGSREPFPSVLPLYLYPVRAIRRKNIGELLLWSAIAQEGERFGITRAPQNPLMRPVYDDWVTFANTLQLPVEFGLGETWQGSFPDLLKSAAALVTTSVAEGFGLTFLEPWLVNRPLIGRKLPEITNEFEDIGLDLSSFYDRLDIPISWIGRERFAEAIRTALTTMYETYDRTIQADLFERAIHAGIVDEYVDFGRLHEAFQKTVMTHLIHNASAKDELKPSYLLQKERASHEMIAHNRRIVTEHYNLTKYKERLISLYQTVAESEAAPLGELDASVLLDQFLAPERFCLLRT